MKKLAIIAFVALVLCGAASIQDEKESKCLGETPCHACKNCHACAFCHRDGGKCGVCK